MRRDLLERTIYRIMTQRDERAAYLQDPAAALSRHRLDEDSTRLVRDLDVGGLIAEGVSPLLTWGMWLVVGAGSPEDYLARLGDGGATT